MDISSVQLSNPYLGYRLDPGEPGTLRQAKASQSAIMVTAQERRNLGRLVSQAYREGRIPIKTSITYKAGFAGSYMAIQAGQTTVVSVPMTNSQFMEPQTEAPEPPVTAESEEPQDIAEPTESGGVTLEDLAREEQGLRAELGAARREYAGAQSGAERPANDIEAQSVKDDVAETERRIEEIERQLAEINMRKLLKEMQDMQELVSSALDENARAPINLISAAFGSDGGGGLAVPRDGGIDLMA